jgi:hypothetical protein
MRRTVVHLAIACLLICAGAALAQDAPEKAPTPMTVEADPPQLDLEDESVEISGETAIDAKDLRVTLAAIAPSGRRYEWRANVIEPGGRFASELRFTFATPEPGPGEARIEPGKWRVVVRSPGGLGSAETTFTVTRTLEGPNEPWARDSANVARAASALAANLGTCVGNMPVSPVRNDLTAAINRLRAHLESGPDRVERDLAAAMRTARTLPDQFEYLEDLTPLQMSLQNAAKSLNSPGGLGAWLDQASTLSRQVADQVSGRVFDP